MLFRNHYKTVVLLFMNICFEQLGGKAKKKQKTKKVIKKTKKRGLTFNLQGCTGNKQITDYFNPDINAIRTVGEQVLDVSIDKGQEQDEDEYRTSTSRSESDEVESDAGGLEPHHLRGWEGERHRVKPGGDSPRGGRDEAVFLFYVISCVLASGL